MTYGAKVWFGLVCWVFCLPSRKLYKLDEPDTHDTAGEAKRNSSVMYSYGPPHMAKQKQDDQLEHTYIKGDKSGFRNMYNLSKTSHRILYSSLGSRVLI